MRYLVILEGRGGELDRREADSEENLSGAILSIAAQCTFAAGDTIKIIDTAPDDE